MNKPLVGSPSSRKCPKCASDTIWRVSRWNKFFHACPKWPACDGKIGAPRGAHGQSIDAPHAGEGTAQGEALPIAEPPLGWNTPSQEAEQSASTAAPPDAEPTPVSELEHAPGQSTLPPPPLKPEPNQAMDNLWAALKPYAMPDVDKCARDLVIASSGIVVAAVKQHLAHMPQAQPASIIQSNHIMLTVNQVPVGELNRPHHKMLGELIEAYTAGLRNIMLVGPAGCGKTTLARDFADFFKLPFSGGSLTAGTPEWHLTGRSMPNISTGEPIYHPSQAVTLYANGGVLLADEMDNADANMLISLNTAIDNDVWNIPHNPANPLYKRHECFVLIACCNTYGQGASSMYSSRGQVDASTLSRFAGAIFTVDYDMELERTLAPAALCNMVWHARGKIKELGLERVMGTRELVKAAKWMVIGKTPEFAFKRLLEGWTEDERKRVC